MGIKSWHGPQLDAVYAMIEEAAVKGERCPTRDQIRERLMAAGLGGNAVRLMTTLCRQGRIFVYVHAKNWRVAEIRRGGHAGESTKPPPRPWAAYLRVGEINERLSA